MEASHQPLPALALVAIVAAAVMMPAAAAAPGHGKPAAYYDSVTNADGDPAPAGTEIVAVVNGSVVDRITVQEAGQYGGEGPTEDKLDTSTHAGDTITFHLGSADGPVANPPGDHPIRNGTHELALVFPASAFDGSSGSGGGGGGGTTTTATTTTSSGGGGSGGGAGSGGGGGTGGGATTTTATTVSTTATTPAKNSTVTSTIETSASDDTSGTTTRASGSPTSTSTTAANATSTSTSTSTVSTTIPDGISRVPTPGFGPVVAIVGALAALLLALRRE